MAGRMFTASVPAIGCSTMRTAGPAAGPAHAFFELGAYSFDMLAPGVIFLDGDGPADPLVARERRYVFPGQQGLGVGCKRFSEIGGEGMDDAGGDSRRLSWSLSLARELQI